MSLHHAADYKARKEAFVSNLSGSSLTEINLVTLVAAVSIFIGNSSGFELPLRWTKNAKSNSSDEI